MEMTSNPAWAFRLAVGGRMIESALDAPGGDPEACAYAAPLRLDQTAMWLAIGGKRSGLIDSPAREARGGQYATRP
jgi:hypothetical protein